MRQNCAKIGGRWVIEIHQSINRVPDIGQADQRGFNFHRWRLKRLFHHLQFKNRKKMYFKWIFETHNSFVLPFAKMEGISLQSSRLYNQAVRWPRSNRSIEIATQETRRACCLWKWRIFFSGEYFTWKSVLFIIVPRNVSIVSEHKHLSIRVSWKMSAWIHDSSKTGSNSAFLRVGVYSLRNF